MNVDRTCPVTSTSLTYTQSLMYIVNRLSFSANRTCVHRCRSTKQDVSASLGMWHRWATRLTCPGPYIRQFAGYPRIGDARVRPSFAASDPGSRPSAAQSWPELSMATRPGQRTLEAARGNGYAPVWLCTNYITLKMTIF